MDNASSNDKCLEEFAKLLQEQEIPFDYRDKRINCLPHVIHIATTYILDKFFPHQRRGGSTVNPEAGPGINDEEDDDDIYEPSFTVNPMT